jgi:hypothetical protein
MNTIISNSSTNGKNSLTFESVVCSQLELKRRAASFSRRRSTMSRRSSIYGPSRLSSNRARISIPVTQFLSTSLIPDISTQLLKAKDSNYDNKRSQTSSTISINGTGLENKREQQSLASMLYWDASSSSSRNITIKKV